MKARDDDRKRAGRDHILGKIEAVAVRWDRDESDDVAVRAVCASARIFHERLYEIELEGDVNPLIFAACLRYSASMVETLRVFHALADLRDAE
jgi:hypothetical protein